MGYPLKVYCDRAYLPEGSEHIEMMYPFWGRAPVDGPILEPDVFTRYVECGRNLFTLYSLSQAEIAVLPTEWPGVHDTQGLLLAQRLSDAAREAGKPLVVFATRDLRPRISLENAWVFRRNLYRSQRGRLEFAFPVWVDDYLARYEIGRLPLRPWTPVPTVGFCGFATPWYARDRVRYAAGRLLRSAGIRVSDPTGEELLKGWRVRARVLRLLARNGTVKTNFLIRRQYFNGAFDPKGIPDRSKWESSRREFVENILQSDYVVCIRGTENYSDRLYETLCCGRIPVFVDTDCVLPFDEDAEWRRICVWIREVELDSLADRLLAFHHALRPEQFAGLQYACRRFWEERLSPYGYFSHFHTHFNKKKDGSARHAYVREG